MHRRGAGATAAGLVVVAGLFVDLGARHSRMAWAEDWPRFLGARGDGRSTETPILTEWPDEGPQILWHVAVGEGYSMASVAHDRVYVFDRLGDAVRLRALRTSDASELWRSEYTSDYEDQFGYSNGPRASPVVDVGAGRVYVFGADGRLRCHDAATGAVVWEHDTQAEYGVVQNFFGAASSPWIEGDLLLQAVGGSPEGDWNNHDGRVEPDNSGMVAFDKATGRVRWRAVDELASYASPIVAELDGRRRVVWLARGGLVLLDPATGAEVASYPFRARRIYSVNASTPVVVGDEIFISESYEKGGALLRFGNGKLEPVWQDPPRRNQALATHWNTAIYDRGVLYGSSGEKTPQAELRAVDWKTGQINWSVPRLGRTTALFADGHLIVLTEYGELLLLRATPQRAQVLERVQLRGHIDGRERALVRHPAWSPPVLADGVLYVRGADRLVALRLREP